MSVIAIHDMNTWNEQIEKSKNENKLVVVDFTATWCGPCRTIAPVFVKFAEDYPNIIFLKVDVDEMAKLSEDYGVTAMPTFIFMKGGVVVDNIRGANPAKLKEKVEAHSQ